MQGRSCGVFACAVVHTTRGHRTVLTRCSLQRAGPPQNPGKEVLSADEKTEGPLISQGLSSDYQRLLDCDARTNGPSGKEGTSGPFVLLSVTTSPLNARPPPRVCVCVCVHTVGISPPAVSWLNYHICIHIGTRWRWVQVAFLP